jgi:hypothetical protein
MALLQPLKTRRFLIIGSIGLIALVIAACLVWANSAWLLTPLWTSIRLNQIRSEMGSVPTLASTSLVDRVDGISLSGVYGCASVYVNELRGSKSLSITDAVYELGAALSLNVQRTGKIHAGGATYQWTSSISLALSDYAIERDLKRFDEVRGKEAERAYKTLFVIGLWQPVYPDGFEERCH